jgi:hypothetical protein
VTAAVLMLGLLAGCGDGGDDPPPTTVTTEAPTTTVVPDIQGIECLRVATEALRLANDFRDPAGGRGVVGPYEPSEEAVAAGRAKAAELRAEHARLGCPGQILRGFLGG